MRALFRADAADAPALALPAPQRRGDAVSLSFGGGFAGGWSNPVTGHGMPGKDSRLASGFTAGFMSDEMAIEMYRGDELTRKIVSMICEESLEPGVTLTIQDEEQTVAGQVDTRKAGDLVEDIERLHRELKTEATIVRACEWERLFGGSAIWAGANDYQAGSFAEPLNLEAKGLAIRWLDVIRARDLTPYAYYEDPLHPKYGQPSVWSLSRVMSGGRIQQQAQIHESRLFLFRGRRIVDDGSVMSQNHHSAEFGDGILPGLVGALRRLSEALGNTEHAMRANGELIWTHQKLAEILGNEGNGDFERLVRAMQFASSILNARVVGADQTLTRQGVSLSGLDALLSEFKGEVAGLAGVPRTKLFAEVPGGLGNNATGPHGDWDETKAVYRKHSQLPAYEWITKLGFRSLGGEPRRWKLEGKPYRHPTEKEQADLVKLEADTDIALLGAAIVTADVVQGRPIWRERFSLPDPEAPEMGALPVGEMPDDIRLPGGAPDPALAGTDPAAAAPAPEQPKAADLALNGAQIIALNSTIKDVAAGQIPRSSGAAIVARAINISIEEAIGMMPPEGFVPSAAPAKAPPVVADARKDAKGERTIEALLKRLSPSGKCAECGKQKPLEVDHVHGRGWDPAEMSKQQRADRYWTEYDGGKKMRALCRECNARDGAKNKQGKSGPAHRGDAISTGADRRFLYVPLPADVVEEMTALQSEIVPPDGIAQEIDHVTLVFCPKAQGDIPEEEVALAVEGLRAAAAPFAPISAKVQGWAYFDGAKKDGEDKTALVALVDAPGITELYVALKETLDAVGMEPSSAHSFAPHFTFCYLEPGERLDDLPALSAEFAIDRVCFANRDVHDIPLSVRGDDMPDPVERARQMIALIEPYQRRALAGEDRDALVATLEFVEGIEPAWAERLIPRLASEA
jgi:phage-related protein (TIGR01555 family)